MAGYSSKREENYEIKYLRKVLGQVDDRIKVPQSIAATSLRPLLDDIERTAPRDAVRRRPRWLSLQSGIAYAAAFALVVALFYSMELYRPEMIDGGMRIAQAPQSTPDIMVADVPDEAGGDGTQTDTGLLLAGAADDGTDEPDSTVQSPAAAPREEAPKQAAFAGGLGIGGGGKSVLLYEDERHEYRWRANDMNDPDKTGPITLEIIGKENLELLTQVDVTDMTDIQHCFVNGDMLLLVGTGGAGITVQAYHNLENPVEQLTLAQSGTLVDARLYKDIVHIVTLSEETPKDAEIIALPNSDAPQACVITAVNLVTLETEQKSFTGAKGTVQLHNLNAYIHYEGKAADGSKKDYIGQILLDGIDIELGTVS